MSGRNGERSPDRPPPVHQILAWPGLAVVLEARGRAATVRAIRDVLGRARSDWRAGLGSPFGIESLALRVEAELAGDRPGLRPAINATGVLLNTNLGRAPLAPEAAEAVDRVVRGYCNLEFDLESGERGDRTGAVEGLLRTLTGAEAALVVNNNAAATVLVLRALALGREVIVSRGQLVEIGGSFRLPEILEVSGARLREVGTTNRTRLADYERAIGPETAALMRVHPSNYRVVGFTESVGIADLARLARDRGLRTIDDIGSGALAPGLPPGLAAGDEPTALDGLEAGADLVLFSGDKLLGGPQSGIVLGSAGAVGLARRDPLMRALRVDKMTLAALEATLRLMLDPGSAATRIPLWDFLGTGVDRLRDRAERLAGRLRAELGLEASAIESTATLGGGSAPGGPLPSAAVRLASPFPGRWSSEGDLARALRLGDPAVVPLVRGKAVVLDLRAVAEVDDAALVGAVRRSLENC